MSQLNITAATSVSISGEQGGTHRRKQPWEEMLQELREYRQHYGDSIVHTHETKLGRWVSTQRQRYFKDELTKAPKHGHVNVPALTTKLGRWVTTQRTRKDAPSAGGHSQLTQQQVRLLEDVGFVWRVTSSYEQISWEDSFAQLQAFRDQHGHVRLPTNDPDCQRLRRWADTQRQKHKQNGLSAEQIQQLDEIGFQWEFFVTEKWDEMYEQLQAYYQQHKHSKVLSREGKLGDWVIRQRMRQRGTRDGAGPLTAEQVDKLNALNFVWEAGDYDEIWNEWFEKLKVYAQTHGNCRVPRLSGPLGAWVARNRQCRHSNSGTNLQLTAEQVQRLDSIGFVWRADDHVDTWEAMYEKLVAYHRQNGDCLVPQKSNGKLGSWVSIQRCRRNGPQNQLTDEQVRLLNQLHFAWNNEERNLQLWDQMYRQLETYILQHGHCHVPSRYVSPGNPKGPAKLGKWVEQQRGRYNGQKGRLPLSESQIERLNELDFVWEVKKRKAAPASSSSVVNRKQQRRTTVESSSRRKGV